MKGVRNMKELVIEFLSCNEQFKRRYPNTPIDLAWHCTGIRSEFMEEFKDWLANHHEGKPVAPVSTVNSAIMRCNHERNGTNVAQEKDTQDAILSNQQNSLPTSAKIIEFPLIFGKDTRVVSNPMARCALFAAVKERQYFKDYVVVGTVNGMLVEIAGEQLNQDDHDTYMQLAMMAFGVPFGDDVVESVDKVLTELGRHTHKEQREQLFDQISRFVRTSIRITPEDMPRYEGHLLDDASTPNDQKTLPRLRRHLAYRLNPKFAGLYSKNVFTLIDFRQRLKIKGRGSELAKWLHLWIEGNAEQYAHKVDTIREKCGSRDKTLKSFRQNLRKSLDLLKDVGIITDWRIDAATDLVHIDRIPSATQLAHLNKEGNAKRIPTQKN